MKTFTLYQLTVEGDLAGIYFGVTTQRLSQRLAVHKWEAQHRGRTLKGRWLQQALSDGARIRISVILDDLDGPTAFGIEQELIRTYGELGFQVKNTNPGGKPNWHSAHTPEHREKARLAIQKANSRTWEVTSPLGVTFTITNLKQFCRGHGLDPGTMSQVAKGRQPNHKGWTCRKLGATAGAEPGCKSAA